MTLVTTVSLLALVRLTILLFLELVNLRFRDIIRQLEFRV